MARIMLRKGIKQRLLQGHPWVFANEVERILGNPLPGDMVEVDTSRGVFLGKGYFNPLSQIRVRLLSRDPEEQIDRSFFLRQIKSCWEYRQKLGYKENCRLVFGEADGLAGLIIDKFNDYFVVQTLTLGMDRWKQVVVEVLKELFAPAGIYERNDVPVRELEGCSQQKGFLGDPFDPRILIREHGLCFQVDLEHGQKTGYYLDQQDNRCFLKPLVAGADVLDAFCYTGSFSCHAAFYGARSVLGLDSSGPAVDMSRLNARLNGLDGLCQFQEANAFDLLKQWAREGRLFDMVLLDPPALTKTREHIGKAVSGYKEINLRGMKLLKRGGFLVTSSCTNLVRPELFLQTVDSAARDMRKKWRQVTFQTQSPDHPVVWGLENSQYLKFLIAEIY